MTTAPYIASALASRFDVSPEFVERIIEMRKLSNLAADVADIDAFISGSGDAWRYVSYALGTNQRAKASLDRMLILASPDRTGTALDVGCGYGGFLNAFLDKGFRPSGVEIDGDLASLARQNLRDAAYKGNVHVGDLFSGHMELGSFDLITVNDVLEHLPDPCAAFNVLAGMLNPGGVLAIYAPNGRSIFYVTADPHNGVLGSSVLPGTLAKTYVQVVLNSTGYGLGEYLGLDHFRDLCDRNALDFRFRPHDGGERPEEAGEFLSAFLGAFQRSGLAAQLPPLLRKSVEIAIWEYVGEFAVAASRAAAGTHYREFNDNYLARAWTIACKKCGRKS